MDADSWSARLSSASKSYQSALQSRSGMRWDSFDREMLMGFDVVDANEDIREEFPCPFCSMYFDIVGLCCHIDDEHPVEAKNGVCPVCAMRVGVDMVAHIMLHHGNIFKVQRKRKSLKVGSYSTLSLLRRELREGNLQSLLGGSSRMISSTSAAPDPLLSSFILPIADDSGSAKKSSSAETIFGKKISIERVSERDPSSKVIRATMNKQISIRVPHQHSFGTTRFLMSLSLVYFSTIWLLLSILLHSLTHSISFHSIGKIYGFPPNSCPNHYKSLLSSGWSGVDFKEENGQFKANSDLNQRIFDENKDKQLLCTLT